MSNLFMDVQQRRLQRVPTQESLANVTSSNLSSDNSFVSSFYAKGESPSGSSLLTNNVNLDKNSNSQNKYKNCEDAEKEEEEEEDFSNFLSLSLKKPKHWKWELSTSRSCSNIALPRILLHDHKGNLLLDINSQVESVFKEQDHKPKIQKTPSRKRSNRCATTNLAHSINQTLGRDFNGLQIEEATPSHLSPVTSFSRTRTPSPNTTTTTSCIDFYTNDLPDYQIERRSSSLKGVRFIEDISKPILNKNNNYALDGLPTPPPSSSNTTPTTPTSSSKSSGPKEKRRYRRSQSSGRSNANSPSILERFSYSRGRLSSPEYAEEQEIYRPPRYYLSTSRAGTLVVAEDSFKRYSRRRVKKKTSSSESIQNCVKKQNGNELSSRSQSSSLQRLATASLGKQKNHADPSSYETLDNHTSSLSNVAELPDYTRRKGASLRRHRSDGNVLLNRQLSSSEENLKTWHEPVVKYPQNFSSLKRHIKSKNILPCHPENGVFHQLGNSEAER